MELRVLRDELGAAAPSVEAIANATEVSRSAIHAALGGRALNTTFTRQSLVVWLRSVANPAAQHWLVSR